MSSLVGQVRDSIARGISAGKYRVGQTLPPAEKLARGHDCSVFTVRRALVDLAEAGLVQRIRKRGTVVLRAPGAGRVCLISPEDAHLSGLLLDAVYQALALAHYSVDVIPAALAPALFQDRVAQLAGGADPRLVVLELPAAQRLPLLWRTFPQRVVFTLHPLASLAPPAHVVGPDPQAMARSVITHLLKLGHRRIAAYAGYYLGAAAPEDSWVWHSAEHARHLVEVAGGTFHYFSMCGTMEEQLQRVVVAQGATAVWAINDDTALHLERACLRLGLQVPEHVSIIGRWDTPWSLQAPKPLTSVSLDPPATAAAIVAALAAAGDFPPGQYSRTLVPTQLIVRSSTAKASSTKPRQRKPAAGRPRAKSTPRRANTRSRT